MITSACVIFYGKYTSTKGKYVIPCHRHHHAFSIITYIMSPWEIDKSRTLQGFLDEKNNFLNRHEAYLETLRCGQIKEKKKEELFSEDLW